MAAYCKAATTVFAREHAFNETSYLINQQTSTFRHVNIIYTEGRMVVSVFPSSLGDGRNLSVDCIAGFAKMIVFFTESHSHSRMYA